MYNILYAYLEKELNGLSDQFLYFTFLRNNVQMMVPQRFERMFQGSNKIYTFKIQIIDPVQLSGLYWNYL
jgi:hypothetical protein